MKPLGGPARTNDNAVIYEEGLQIPRLKFVAQGELDPTVAAFIATNVRVPEQTLGDLWGQVAAVAVVATLPIIVFTFLVQRHLVRGLTFGAVKG